MGRAAAADDHVAGPAPRLTLTNVSKRYPGVQANDRVSLTVMPGEIHAVLGENGAGKSTLMKIIYGAVRPDEGTLAWNGAPVAIHSPRQARALGIAMVFQHFALFETLTVAENVWLGHRQDDDPRRGGARGRARVGSLRPRARGRAAGLEPLGRGAAAGGDPARAAHEPAAPDPRRADGRADAPDGGAAVRHPAPARRGGVLDRLHQSQARRGPRALHALHRAARRDVRSARSIRASRPTAACRS